MWPQRSFLDTTYAMLVRRPRHLKALLPLVRLLARRGDVEVEDPPGDIDRCTRVREVHDTGEPSLDRRRTQDHVRLDVGVAELHKVIDGVVAGALVRQLRVQVVLLAGGGHQNTGECNPTEGLRIGGAGQGEPR